MAPSRSGQHEQLANQAAAGDFPVAISLLRSDATTARLVLHVTTYVSRNAAASVADYFGQGDLAHFEGLCPYFIRNCYQKELALFRPYYPGAESRHLAISQISKVARLLEEGFAGNIENAASLQALIHLELSALPPDG